MIIKTETYAERNARLIKWHAWFAWYPVEFDGAWVWLSYVDRCMLDDGYSFRFQYRLIE